MDEIRYEVYIFQSLSIEDCKSGLKPFNQLATFNNLNDAMEFYVKQMNEYKNDLAYYIVLRKASIVYDEISIYTHQ